MIKNLLLNNTTQGLNFGSRWVLNIILAKKLSLEEYALFSFMYAVSNILASTMSFGSELFIIKDKEHNYSTIIESILISLISFLSLLFIWIIIILFKINIDNIDLIIFSLILGFMISINYILSSYFKSMNFFKYDLKNTLVIFSLMSILILYVLVFVIDSSVVIFISLIIINILAIIYIVVSHKLSISVNIFKLNKNIYKKRLYFGLHAIQSTIYAQIGLLILFYLLSKDEYAIYRIFFLIIMPLALFNSSISQVLLVKFKNFNSYFNMVRFFRLSSIFLLFSAICINILLYNLQPFIFHFFNISDEYKMIFILFLIIPTAQILNITYSSMLTNLGYQKIRFYSTTFSAIITVVAMIYFVREYGVKSAIIINIIAFTLLFVINFFATEYIIRKEKNVN